MTESPETTLEEARRCSKCGQPGKAAGVREAPKSVTRGAKLHSYTCDNNRCQWYGQVCRVIQVNPDGTIPPALTKRDKQFPEIPDMTDRINDIVAAQLEAEKAGGAEINR
jgi:hypothetical protein